jgi:hydrogenase maturation protein HypF
LTWRAKFQRLGHLRYLPLIGGEAAILHPMRIAASYLIYLMGEAAFAALPGMDEHRSLLAQLNLSTNVVFTSSTGRLFDAVSAILGVCRNATFDGQAPALLEALADPRERGCYFQEQDLRTVSSGAMNDERRTKNEMVIIDPQRWLDGLLAGLRDGISPAKLSRRFHNTIIAALAFSARSMVRKHKAKAVCLSGGSFQNRLLLHGVTQALVDARIPVFTNHAVPVNDGGLSFGQAIVADAQLKR